MATVVPPRPDLLAGSALRRDAGAQTHRQRRHSRRPQWGSRFARSTPATTSGGASADMSSLPLPNLLAGSVGSRSSSRSRWTPWSWQTRSTTRGSTRSTTAPQDLHGRRRSSSSERDRSAPARQPASPWARRSRSRGAKGGHLSSSTPLRRHRGRAAGQVRAQRVIAATPTSRGPETGGSVTVRRTGRAAAVATIATKIAATIAATGGAGADSTHMPLVGECGRSAPCTGLHAAPLAAAEGPRGFV